MKVKYLTHSSQVRSKPCEMNSNISRTPRLAVIYATVEKLEMQVRCSFFCPDETSSQQHLTRCISTAKMRARPTDDCEELNRMSTNDRMKRGKISNDTFAGIDNCESSDVHDDNDGAAEEDNVIDSSYVFKPLFTMGVWEDIGSEDKRISIAILLPSGIGERKKDHDIRVSDDGLFLQISVVWPPALTDVEMLHRKWSADDQGLGQLALRTQAFKRFLKTLRTTKNDAIQSSYNISLPFVVKSDIADVRKKRCYLSWLSLKTHSRVLYVTLEAPPKDYGLDDDEVPVFHEC